jgi:transposase
MSEYEGHQYVGVDLHRRRSVIVRQTEDGIQLSAVRILNDPVALGLQIEQAGCHPDVVLEATHGWYWAADVLQAAGALWVPKTPSIVCDVQVLPYGR